MQISVGQSLEIRLAKKLEAGGSAAFESDWFLENNDPKQVNVSFGVDYFGVCVLTCCIDSLFRNHILYRTGAGR